MVDPNRKINRLTEKDIEFLDELEEEFKNRFTSDDEEFLKHCQKQVIPPPIADPWVNRNYDGNNRNRNNHGGRFHRGNFNRRGGGGGGRTFNRQGQYNRPGTTNSSRGYHQRFNT